MDFIANTVFRVYGTKLWVGNIHFIYVYTYNYDRL